MGQLYMQKFENWGVMSKSDFDGTWGVGLEKFESTGNWGGVENGIKHHGTYVTSWGGYVLFEADGPQSFAAYQDFHYRNYAHHFKITFEPVVNMDEGFSG